MSKKEKWDLDELARQIIEFTENPPAEVIERMWKAQEERRKKTPTCTCLLDGHSFNCFWHKRMGI